MYLRKLFRELFVREGFTNDNIFDWTILRQVRHRASHDNHRKMKAGADLPAL